MTANELLDAYPAVKDAVAYVEMFLCVSPDPWEVSAWEMITKSTKNGLPATPKEVADIIRGAVADIIETEKELLAQPGGPNYCRIFIQMTYPQFLTYVRGKMGAV